jgi:hypothetical protein
LFTLILLFRRHCNIHALLTGYWLPLYRFADDNFRVLPVRPTLNIIGVVPPVVRDRWLKTRRGCVFRETGDQTRYVGLLNNRTGVLLMNIGGQWTITVN